MANKKSNKKNKSSLSEIKDYDDLDTSALLAGQTPLIFEDIGLKLPPQAPTQVVSIRLPTELLNRIKALGSQEDIPYQALIKLFLSEAVKKKLA